MLPTLEPGWFVLVDPGGALRDGSIVVAEHPERSDLFIVKRSTGSDGGAYWLSSDNEADGSDSRAFGPVTADAIIGAVTLVLDRPRLRVS